MSFEGRIMPLSEEDRVNAERNGFIREDSEIPGKSPKKLVKKTFNKNSYNGPTQQDFIDRINIIFETIEQRIKSENQTQLEQLKWDAINQINETCVIDPIKIADLLDNEEHVVLQIKKALKIIQNFVAQSIPLIDEKALSDPSKFKTLVKEIEKEESQLTAKKGRPDFINYYPTVDPNITRVSVQEVVGDRIIPSTVRDEAKLPNFVKVKIGYQSSGTKDQIQFEGYRHSSLIPLAIDDDYTRRQYTSRIAKEIFAELAKGKKPENGKDVIEISLASLALLSPKGTIERAWVKDDRFAWVPKQQEYRQLKESYDALMMYNGRVIEIDGPNNTKIKVKPTINIINTPANPLGADKNIKKLRQPLEKNINTQGMNQFIADGASYCIKNGLPNVLGGMDDSKLVSEISKLKETLKPLYGKLDDSLSARQNYRQNYKKTKNKINELEREMYGLEMKLMDQRKQWYKTNKKKISGALTKLTGSDEKSLFMQLYCETVAMYMDDAVEPAQVGARYLLANQAMGSSVDFFCKSGEDRTGRMHNLLEELCEFSRKNGRYPQYLLQEQCIAQKDVVEQQKIAVYASEFSVSRDINGQNVHGARGLQIVGGLGPLSHTLNDGLPNKSGDALGKLAREAYYSTQALAPKLETRLANTLMESRGASGFTTQRMHKSKHHAAPAPKQPLARVTAKTAQQLPSVYQGICLKKDELLVSTKEYETDNNSTVVARLEQERDPAGAREVRDLTPDIPKLDVEDDREIAMEQVKMALMPPYKTSDGPIVLGGRDPVQKARVYAALLYLKESHADLKNLEIQVKGKCKTPVIATQAGDQRTNNLKFISEQLGMNIDKTHHHKQELHTLIDKQNTMKTSMKAMKGTENQGLSLVEGTSFTTETTKGHRRR
jgi:hypothetical protein